MICQACKDSGQKSRVYDKGTVSTLLGGHHSWWDEEGIRHSHNPNRYTTSYICSRGHQWTTVVLAPCPAGDFGNE